MIILPPKFACGRQGAGVLRPKTFPGHAALGPDRFDRVFDAAVEAWLAIRAPQALRPDLNGSMVVCWDHARFMNHSCDPTSIGVGSGFEIARHDVRRGDELT